MSGYIGYIGYIGNIGYSQPQHPADDRRTTGGRPADNRRMVSECGTPARRNFNRVT